LPPGQQRRERETTAAELAIDAGVVAAAPIAALPTEQIQLPRAGLSIAPDLAEIFREEAAAHLATLEREFTRLQTDPAAPTTHEMYRAAHTLAGIAGTVGIPAVNCLSHALERALVRRNQGAQRDSLEAFETVRQAIAALALMLADVAREHEPEEFPPCSMSSAPCTRSRSSTSRQCRSRPTTERKQRRPNRRLRSVAQSQRRPARPLPSDVPQLQDELDEQLLPLFLEEALDLNQNIAAQLHAWRSNPADTEPVRRLARLFHTLKGSARMAGAMNLGELTHAIETRMQEAQEAGRAPLELIDDIDNAFDVIVQIVERLQRGETSDAPVEISDQAALELAAEAPAPVTPVDQGAAANPSMKARRTRRHSGRPCACAPT
jgi:chemosensory pili system protein ChpA (sensor histidine kinase/response regulator)